MLITPKRVISAWILNFHNYPGLHFQMVTLAIGKNFMKETGSRFFFTGNFGIQQVYYPDIFPISEFLFHGYITFN